MKLTIHTVRDILGHYTRLFPKATFAAYESYARDCLEIDAISVKSGQHATRVLDSQLLHVGIASVTTAIGDAMASAYREVCPPEIPFRIGTRGSPRRLQAKP